MRAALRKKSAIADREELEKEQAPADIIPGGLLWFEEDEDYLSLPSNHFARRSRGANHNELIARSHSFAASHAIRR